MDNVNKADYDYFLQVRDVENINLNGYSEIDIYTKGEKKIIEIGDWKVVPVVKMPFCWSGYSLELKAFDVDSNLFVFKGNTGYETIFKKINFLKEAKWIIQKIKDLKDIENVYHAELIETLDDLIRYADSISKDYLFIDSLKK